MTSHNRPGGRLTPLGPGGRPFRGWRIVPLLLSLGALAANAVILLSDRAPGLFRRLSARIDAGVSRAAGAAGVGLPDSSVGVPRSDFDVHVVIWAVAALLIGLASWSWASLLLGSATVFASSVALELAQRSYSRSRTVQSEDVVANAVGVVAGTCVVVAFTLVWKAVSAMRSRFR